MAYSLNEDSLERAAHGPSTITGAVGSNQSIDMAHDLQLHQKSKDQAKNLLSTSPSYAENFRKWLKYLDLYESNDIYRYIFRHLRETESSWKKRVERGYFNNYLASVVDLYTSYIFSSPVDRFLGKVSKYFPEKFYKNVDFRGNNYKTFMMDVATYTQVEGHVGIIIDSPATEELISERDRIDGDVRPFLTLLHAHQILDYELDEFGRFEWVKYCLASTQKRNWDQPADPDAKTIVVWSKQSVQVYEITGSSGHETSRLVKETVNPIGDEVPIVICRFRKQARHPWYGVSSVRDIADMNIGILNWSSLGDEEIFERCLNVLIMQKQHDDAKIELSHHNVLEYDGENPPQYLTPGATPLRLIKEWVEFHIEDILRLAKLKGPTGMKDSRQASSGIAYAFEFNETNQTLSNRAEALEQTDYEIHRIISKYFGEEFEGMVAYPREFGVDDNLVELQVLTIARQGLTTETGIREVEKRVIRKIFAKTPTDLRAKMEREIDAAEAKPEFESLFQGKPLPEPGEEDQDEDEGSAPAEEAGNDDGDSEPESED